TLQSLCERQKLKYFATSRTQSDITDLDTLRRCAEKNGPTHIVNCAAYTDVDGAEKHPEYAFKVNSEGAENLAVVAKEIDTRLVHISTNFVFDGLKKTPYFETDPCSPLGVYGKSKWEGEQKVLDVFPTACVIRTSWLFGRGGKSFISSLIDLLKKHQEMRVVEDQTASLTFCEDLASAILRLLCHTGIFHYANRGECSKYQIAEEIFKETKCKGASLACNRLIPVPSTAFPSAAPRPFYSVLNTRKVEGVLGTSPRLWTEVLKDFLNEASN
ncbi:MAG TPA: dTDP-4-dehydrorhamnose reductase, partial [Rhabdochlamydiaceae bacterium]|nr:dTDP-4-dehydrorhamnose reductase [Rhabdochlamydiaceae bacterium]